jgi:hypothetical protein
VTPNGIRDVLIPVLASILIVSALAAIVADCAT